jgi:hypothetical protein
MPTSVYCVSTHADDDCCLAPRIAPKNAVPIRSNRNDWKRIETQRRQQVDAAARLTPATRFPAVNNLIVLDGEVKRIPGPREKRLPLNHAAITEALRTNSANRG